MTDEYRHTPVLLAECLEGLALKPRHIFVDATLGGAGHSCEAAGRLGADGLLIGIDQDDAALAAAGERLRALPEKERPRIKLLKGNSRRAVGTGPGAGDRWDSLRPWRLLPAA